MEVVGDIMDNNSDIGIADWLDENSHCYWKKAVEVVVDIMDNNNDIGIADENGHCYYRGLWELP